MSDRYNTPSAGTENWHEPLNENFNHIGRDIEGIKEELEKKSDSDHDHAGETIAPAKLDGDVVDRTEPISSLSGDIYVVEDGSDDPTQHDGDIVFYV
ncbi:hypothetical protein [Natronosalvus vescus]|uniref:hypothetical protein n=1 Tax=Natronosalvus vescus TaxID=2953881 RepID=UPI002090115B|nr:hypothetical protein [Natronosalvus vescus]